MEHGHTLGRAFSLQRMRRSTTKESIRTMQAETQRALSQLEARYISSVLCYDLALI